MNRFGVIAAGRCASGAAIWLMTAVYGVVNCSPFAFDMLIRPQLFPWIARFVAWHHLWMLAAYLVSLATIVPELDWRQRREGRARAAHVAALTYAVLAGAVTAWLLLDPILPKVWNNALALPVALAAFIPPLWLGVIDHLSVAPPWRRADSRIEATSPRRFARACVVAGGYLWVIHLLRASLRNHPADTPLAWLLVAAWTLSLTVAAVAIVSAALQVIAGVSARARRAPECEFFLLVAAIALAVSELFRRSILPTASVDPGAATLIAWAAGIAFAVAWSGLMLRRARSGERPALSTAELLVGPGWGRAPSALALVVLPAVTFWALGQVERRDWDFVAQRLILALAWTAAFGLVLGLTRARGTDPPRSRWLVVPALIGIAGLVLVPRAAMGAAARTGDPRVSPKNLLDRQLANEIGFRTLADALIEQLGEDRDYYRFLQADTNAQATVAITDPDVNFGRPMPGTASRPPDVYIFVIDSLRRDYLSAYNPRVSFTPNFGSFAADSFAYLNAFTRHGGTELAVPSIWSGTTVARRALATGFDRMNALEKLVRSDGYRLLIDDFILEDVLLPTTGATRIDPGVLTADTDLCRNLESLEQALDQSDPRPVMAYLRPMNLHILNTQRAGQRSLDGEYPGFYAPYASRLRRIDGCFGEFVSYLKARGRYDRSIILITGDHGDTLGEGGRWGHGSWLTPGVVRVPLLVRVPPAWRGTVTTDLGRIAFTTDIVPTLYALRGAEVPDRGIIAGQPLIVPRTAEPSDRRREAYLLTSSYGAAYGLLWGNGRFLYVTDLLDWGEFAYDMSEDPLGQPMAITADLRRAVHGRIREQVEALAQLYGIGPVEIRYDNGRPVTPHALPLTLTILLGLAFGSFFNVCIYRVPRRLSLVRPGSRCPGCGESLQWYDNIPVVSYAWLAGKCRTCRQPISARYPIVEFLTCAVFVLHYLVFGLSGLLVARLVLASALVVLFAIDLEHHLLPDVITLPGIVAGLAFSAVLPPGIRDAILGVVAGGGVLWLIGEAYYRYAGDEGMGGGDVKMLAMIGAFLGWKLMIVTLVVSSFAGSFVGLLVIARATRRHEVRAPVRDVPALGALVASLIGDRIIAWYLGL